MTNELTIVDRVRENPALVLVEPESFDPFYDRIRAEVMGHEADLSTDKGRKAIASLAHKVVRTKTAIDAAGKKLNEDARARINAVDAARRTIREKLDALAEEVRKPLTAWEAAEELRVSECNGALTWIRNAATILADDTAETLDCRLNALDGYGETDASWREFGPMIAAAKQTTRDALTVGIERLKREKAERAELARLRAEAEARAEADRIAAEEAARAEAERLAAERAEQARKDADAREQARIEAARQEAAQAAQREAERIAREAQAERDRKHEEELAAQRAEAARLQREANERAEAERKATEALAARERDKAHRSAVMKAAKEDIMEAGCVSEDQAKSIVLAICGGNVRNVNVRF